VDGQKSASLGLRLRQGCSFHGLALNIDMDLEPFQRINPCGYAGLEMVQCRDFVPEVTYQQVEQLLVSHLSRLLNTSDISFTEGLNKSYE
jgi:lipoyl(octanoyl) transferase